MKRTHFPGLIDVARVSDLRRYGIYFATTNSTADLMHIGHY
jgi:hypothetical protein